MPRAMALRERARNGAVEVVMLRILRAEAARDISGYHGAPCAAKPMSVAQGAAAQERQSDAPPSVCRQQRSKARQPFVVPERHVKVFWCTVRGFASSPPAEKDTPSPLLLLIRWEQRRL